MADTQMADGKGRNEKPAQSHVELEARLFVFSFYAKKAN